MIHTLQGSISPLYDPQIRAAVDPEHAVDGSGPYLDHLKSIGAFSPVYSVGVVVGVG